jgi:hypothetical protein
MSSIPTVNVGGFDLGGISDADLENVSKSRESKSSFAGYIETPARYSLQIEAAKVTNVQVDGAGKQWKNVLITATDTETGKKISDFVSVPVDSAVYTSKNGKTNSVRSKIFAALVRSITGNKITTENLQQAAASVESILVPGAKFDATTKYKDNYVKYLGKNAGGELTFGLALATTNELITDDLGDKLIFTSKDAAAEYHRQLFGRAPARGMGFVSFLPTAKVA